MPRSRSFPPVCVATFPRTLSWRRLAGSRLDSPGPIGPALFGMLILALPGSAQQILEIHPDTLTTYRPGGATTVQDVRPIALQRGVNLEGSQRSAGALPWALAGNPFEQSWQGHEALGDLRLATGSYSPFEVDIALPNQAGPWIFGRTYNARQESTSGTRDSNGPQGFNWSQLAAPEIVVYEGTSDTDDVLYLVYGADRFIEFNRIGPDGTIYKSKNGAAGLFVFKHVDSGPDLWEYTDQHGNLTVFFGFDAESQPANGQIWKWVPQTDSSTKCAFVGDKTSASTAISSGFDANGRMLYLFDIADRRYSIDYSSSTIGGAKRMMSVTAETKTGGTWSGTPTGVSTAAKVEYSYYDGEAYGTAGDLKFVKVTNVLDGSTTQIKKKLYRYYTGSYNATTNPGYPHAIKYVYDFEGYRRADLDEGSGLDDGVLAKDDDDDVGTGSQFMEYSAAHFEYDTSHRISKATFNGQCGCSGGASGEHQFAYSGTGYSNNTSSYDTAPATTTIVTQPDGHYLTQYFDEAGQALGTLVTIADPASYGTIQKWFTGVERGALGTVIGIHMPENMATLNLSTGAATYKSSQGLNFVFNPTTSGNLTGFVTNKVGHSAGTSGSGVYEHSVTWTTFSFTVGSTSIVRPLIASTTQFPSASTDGTGGETTTFDWTAWSSSLVPQGLRVTYPSVSTTNNGSGSATYAHFRYLEDGSLAWERSEDKVVSYHEYQNGQETKRIQDANTSLTSSGQDFSGITPPALPSESTGTFATDSSAQGLHHKVVTSFDPQGRVSQSQSSYGTNAPYTVSPVYRTRLGDQREVTLRYADYASGTGTWYGPVDYQVSNQAGKGEVDGLIAVSTSGSTASQSAHIDETDTDPITAVDTGSSFGSLARMTVMVHSEPGTQVDEVRSYFLLPSSGAGTEGTNFDKVTYGYDPMGRRWRTVDATGTIHREVFDARGKVIERWVGTNDYSFTNEGSGPDDMFKNEVRQFDDATDAGMRGLLTNSRLRVDSNSAHDRVTSYLYDARGRLIVEVGPAAPWSVVKSDNLGREIARGLYSSSSGLSASTDPTSTTTNRLALQETAYDERGRAWKTTQHKITQSGTGAGSSTDSIDHLTWFDAEGRRTKIDGPDLVKWKFDSLGRLTDRYTLAKENSSSFSGSHSLTGDFVLQESQTRYDPANGEVAMTATISRLHSDYGTGESTGTLDSNSDSDAMTLTAANIAGRVQVAVYYHDVLEREVDRVEYGQFNGTSFSRPTSAPSRSADELRTTTVYATDGTVSTIEDPRGLVTKYEHDALGRTTKEIRNFDSGVNGGAPDGSDDNVTTKFQYSKGLQTKLIADMPTGTSDQETLYIYGTVAGTPSDNVLGTRNLIRGVKYPDSTNTGSTYTAINSSDADVVSFVYNGQGEVVSRKDQAGNVISTEYDGAGRTTARIVSTLASGFDGAVRRIDTVYEGLGRPLTVTQRDAVSSGSITDEVKFAYEGWGNIETFRQDRDSAVDASGSVNDYAVSYAFAKATTGRNTIRKTSMALPGSKTISYGYLSRSGLPDNAASRVTEMKDGTVVLATWDYNGVGQVVGTGYPEAEAYSRLYDGSSPPVYDGLDKFDRVTKSRWTKDLTTLIDFYGVELTHDEDSNITTATDAVWPGFDVKYTMDSLNRLTRAQEGTLSSGSISSQTRDQEWLLGQTGNWDRNKVNLNGDADYLDTGEVDDTRSHNTVNEILTRDEDSNSGTTENNYSPAYDAVGNLTDDKTDYIYDYDAFNRLRKIRWTLSPTKVIAEYKYNGLGYRIAVHTDTDADNDVDSSDSWYFDAYDPRWRQVARFIDSSSSPSELFVSQCAGRSGSGDASYIDLVACRYRDKDQNGTLEERLYYCQNWRADVSAIIGSDGTAKEWVKYSAYGVPTCIPAGDVDQSGVVDSTDSGQVQTWINAAIYNVRGDVDLDGDIDVSDKSLVTGGLNGLAGGRGGLSSSLAANNRGYAGYSQVECDEDMWNVRQRVLDSMLGQWSSRDPLNYVDGLSLYSYVSGRAIVVSDPLGQQGSGTVECWLKSAAECRACCADNYTKDLVRAGEVYREWVANCIGEGKDPGVCLGKMAGYIASVTYKSAADYIECLLGCVDGIPTNRRPRPAPDRRVVEIERRMWEDIEKRSSRWWSPGKKWLEDLIPQLPPLPPPPRWLQRLLPTDGPPLLPPLPLPLPSVWPRLWPSPFGLFQAPQIGVYQASQPHE